VTARIYTVGKARVLELPGTVDLVVNLKTHAQGVFDLSVGIFEPSTAGQAFRPALAWCMGSRCSLQDDAQGSDAHAALWVNDTQFRVGAADVPVIFNFLGSLLIDGRHATTTRARA
jgi:hypothetical protein